MCDLARRDAIDPIVSPGVVPSMHEHDFAGNLDVGPASTGDQLRAGPTNCDADDDRSAYWYPTIRRNGVPVDPDHVVVYYRAPPDVTAVVALPIGLELVGGGAEGTFGWTCGGGRLAATPPASCPAGDALRLHVAFPECWDGRPDWDAAAPSAVAATAAGCPAAFPQRLPQIELVVHTGLTGALGDVDVSSAPHAPPHADAIVAWTDGRLPDALARCLADHVECPGGAGS